MANEVTTAAEVNRPRVMSSLSATLYVSATEIRRYTNIGEADQPAI